MKSPFFLLTVVVVLSTARATFATSAWEVAVMFLGAAESPEYQEDIDRNIIELARLTPGPNLKLSVYRELAERGVQYFPDPASLELHPLGALLSKEAPLVDIPGRMEVRDRASDSPSLVTRPELSNFLARAFTNPSARRMLILYGHGLGYQGMKAISLKGLRSQLERSVPARSGKVLDVLWLDACFMASLEAAYELRGLARRFMASEEAEFSAGAPFDSLQDLLGVGPDELDQVTRGLAERFLESYSFLERGSQTSAVTQSSATLSVIDPEKLSGLVASLKELSGQIADLSDDWKTRLTRRLPKIQMENKDVVDFGSLLLELKSLRLVPTVSGSPLKKLLAQLEIGRRGKLTTNPRILARAPRVNSQLVYGYENWTRGNEGDQDVLEILPRNLTPEGFVDGPRGKRWPERAVRARLYLTPFTVGLSAFHFYFIDPVTHARISDMVTHVRRSDYVVFAADTDLNPVRYTGYTQGIGKSAEKYSGFNIVNPTGGVPELDYLQLDLYGDSHWPAF